MAVSHASPAFARALGGAGFHRAPGRAAAGGRRGWPTAPAARGWKTRGCTRRSADAPGPHPGTRNPPSRPTDETPQQRFLTPFLLQPGDACCLRGTEDHTMRRPTTVWKVAVVFSLAVGVPIVSMCVVLEVLYRVPVTLRDFGVPLANGYFLVRTAPMKCSVTKLYRSEGDPLVNLRRGGAVVPFPEAPFQSVRADFPHTA